jgi:hypothetical protein
MMEKVNEAVQNNDIYQAKHVVGEYFIAVSRRFASLVLQAESSGRSITLFIC